VTRVTDLLLVSDGVKYTYVAVAKHAEWDSVVPQETDHGVSLRNKRPN